MNPYHEALYASLSALVFYAFGVLTGRFLWQDAVLGVVITYPVALVVFLLLEHRRRRFDREQKEDGEDGRDPQR